MDDDYWFTNRVSFKCYYFINNNYYDIFYDNQAVVNHETWVMNLEDARKGNTTPPVWYKSYSAKEAYNMTALRPDDWNKLISDLTTNSKMFTIYYT